MEAPQPFFFSFPLDCVEGDPDESLLVEITDRF
jgi:hypothetical protein